MFISGDSRYQIDEILYTISGAMSKRLLNIVVAINNFILYLKEICIEYHRQFRNQSHFRHAGSMTELNTLLISMLSFYLFVNDQ